MCPRNTLFASLILTDVLTLWKLPLPKYIMPKNINNPNASKHKNQSSYTKPVSIHFLLCYYLKFPMGIMFLILKGALENTSNVVLPENIICFVYLSQRNR